jgi:hypothetical protein
MTPLLLGLLLLVPCEHPALAPLADPAHQAGCALLGQPAPVAPELAPLAEIYAQPGFERAAQRNSGALQAWLAQARAWLARLFESTGAERYSSATRVLVLALAIAGALAGLLRVRRRAPRGDATAARAGTTPGPQRARWREQVAEAERVSGEQPREALRLAGLALVGWLEEARLSRPGHVLTNRELVGQLRQRGASPMLSERVEALLTRFDQRFYSLATIDQAEARDFVSALRGLTGAAP